MHTEGLTSHPAEERCPIYFVLILLCAVMWNQCAAYYQWPFSQSNSLQGIPALVPSQEMGFVTVFPSSNPDPPHLSINN